MIAVIVLPGPSAQMLGLDARQSLSLLPLGDRPFLQHIIESLVAQKITLLEILTAHAPEKVEALLGNGDRWGCRLRYHLTNESNNPYRSLRVISEVKSDSWLLIHAAKFPRTIFSEVATYTPALFYIPPERNAQSNSSHLPPDGGGDDSTWGGTVLFPAGDWGEHIANISPGDLELELARMIADSTAASVTPQEWMDVSTPAAILDSQAKLLNKAVKGITIGGIERQKGIWISRNVVIHPGAKLVAPLYIGPDSRIGRNAKLGPETVIAGSCIVDTNTTVEHSLILAGTYVGAGLELNRTIVDRDLLVNVGLGTSINISESFLLGGLGQRPRRNWIARAFRAIVAFLFIVLLLPVSLLSMLYFAVTEKNFLTSIQVACMPVKGASSQTFPAFSLFCLGPSAWQVHRPAGWSSFLRQFLPGLYSVLLGRIAFVGLPPKTLEEMQKLPAEWRALYEESCSGLITEAGLAATGESDAIQLYLSDAYYVARRSWRHDCRLVLEYFSRLFRRPGRA